MLSFVLVLSCCGSIFVCCLFSSDYYIVTGCEVLKYIVSTAPTDASRKTCGVTLKDVSLTQESESVTRVGVCPRV
jgi:hypothetical protein